MLMGERIHGYRYKLKYQSAGTLSCGRQGQMINKDLSSALWSPIPSIIGAITTHKACREPPTHQLYPRDTPIASVSLLSNYKISTILFLNPQNKQWSRKRAASHFNIYAMLFWAQMSEILVLYNSVLTRLPLVRHKIRAPLHTSANCFQRSNF